MPNFEIKRGDEFAVRGDSWISKAIIFLSKWVSLQNKAEYSHTGIILNTQGQTVEALYNGIKMSSLEAYKGKKIIIVRNTTATDERKEYAIGKVKELVGKHYPYHRIVLHAIGLGKLSPFNEIVCSEVGKWYQSLAMDDGSRWYGYKPYRLVMDWRISKHYEIVYEGAW